jgi:hypothetical protein
MFVFLLLSLELHIFPNPIEGKVGENIPFIVRLLDEEGKTLTGRLNFSVTPNSLGEVHNNFFIAKEEGKGVLRCRAEVKGKYAAGFAYIRISAEEKAKISPPFAILKKGERTTFTIIGGSARAWKCLPPNIGEIENGVFTARNTGEGRVIAILENGEVKTAFIRVKGIMGNIIITPRFKKVKTGETVQFTVKGNEKITWRVEGEKIGEISPTGLFSASSPGKAVIVAEKNGSEERAIVVVSGEVGLRIIPETAELKVDETIHFRVIGEGFGNINVPVRWEVIPKRLGIIRKDGTFIAGKVPTKGRVVAVLPERFGKGVVSAEVYITPLGIKSLAITPSFNYLEIGQEFPFKVENAEGIAVKWRVIPEDLGTISSNGVFTPKRLGAGVLVAEPGAEINIRPGKAFVVIVERRIILDSILDSKDGTLFFGGEAGNYSALITTPAPEVIEGFRIPLTINTNVPDYQVIWRVIPQSAGKIILNREFEASKLPDGVNEINARIIAILYHRREILAVTAKEIKIIKRQ